MSDAPPTLAALAPPGGRSVDVGQRLRAGQFLLASVLTRAEVVFVAFLFWVGLLPVRLSRIRAYPRRAAGVALAALSLASHPTLAAPTLPPTLTLELRWVTLAVPTSPDAPASDTRSWSTRRPSDAVEPLGPVLRLVPGEWSAWTVGAETPTMAVRVPHGAVTIQAAVPLAAPMPAKRLQALARWQGPQAPVGLRLRWAEAQGDAGAVEAVETTVDAPLNRWVTVLREPSGAAPAPAAGEWRSRDAALLPSRELQVRVRALPAASAP
jgi:hypothetical protein